MSAARLLLCPLLLLAAAGCARKVDSLVMKRVVPAGLAVADTGKACALGEALAHPLAATSRPERPPRQAMVIAELTSAVCEEQAAWQAELDEARAAWTLKTEGSTDTAPILDARIAAERAHVAAADRFYRAFLSLEQEFGTVGDGCPKLRNERDELAYLVGMVAGLLGLLNDRAGAGGRGVPQDLLGKVARGAECLDDARWWYTPGALQAASWATVPGSGPEGVDPIAVLEEHAVAGEASGVRVARALSVLIYENTDRRDALQDGIRAHATSLQDTRRHPEFALLDAYAHEVTLHRSDLLWSEARGHRTPSFGELPGDDAQPTEVPDDPFGDEDPFGDAP